MGLIRHSVAALSALALGPLLGVVLAVRPSLRRGMRERLGALEPRREGRIQVHASSLGEAKAAARLIRELEASGHAVRATTSTLAGRDIFRRDFPSMPSSLAPLDHPWLVARALRRSSPMLSVLIETELWPSWIAAAAGRGIPIVVASGRLSDRSFPRYRRIRRLMRSTLHSIDAVGARTDTDAERFVELGVPEARVRITGDLKLDPPSHRPALAIDLIRALADVPVVVGGSTHPGEEDALLDAQDSAEKEGHGFALVLAPRRVDRASDVARSCRRRQRRVHLRSQLGGRHLVPGEVLVLDTLGELSALYATASVAFVGGTLVPVGGHNIVEPVHAGCPVLFGPRFENVRKVVEILEVGGAGQKVANGSELIRALVECFDDLEACRTRGEIGRASLEAHRGSVERTGVMIEEVLERRGLGRTPGFGARIEASSRDRESVDEEP
ncbi:MAG: glycosyltransferase [Deltaproteobacteria bacterium]|nr:glycosyltransferase [Deltaproteobacteria bacterium]